MKPLRIALIHRDSRRCTSERMVGIWSAPVPEFNWVHFPVAKGFEVSRELLAWENFDAIFYEDGKLEGTFIGHQIPLIYYVVDSTLSPGHYRQRRVQAEQADLILIDHDKLDRFEWKGGPPVRRLSHCVNTRYFRDWGEEKTIDVSFHCHTKGSKERKELEDWLREFCRKRQYVYAHGKRFGLEYGKAFNKSKVTVNLTRTPQNRPHRVLDAMACKTCLLTSTLPEVSGEGLEEGVHYVGYGSTKDLGKRLDDLLMPEHELWRQFGDVGYAYVQSEHTWPVRARQLQEILKEELGI